LLPKTPKPQFLIEQIKLDNIIVDYGDLIVIQTWYN